MSAEKDKLKAQVHAAQVEASADALLEKRQRVEQHEEKQRAYDERCERVGNAGQLFLQRAREVVDGLPERLTTELQLVYDEEAEDAPYFVIVVGQPEGVEERLSVTLLDDGHWQVKQHSGEIQHAATDEELRAELDEYLKPLLLQSAKARGRAAQGIDPADG
jgi:hypothetical protein